MSDPSTSKPGNGESAAAILPPFFGFSEKEKGVPVAGFGGIMERMSAELQQELSQRAFVTMPSQGFSQQPNGECTWDGLPYKGKIYPIKNEDPPSRRPQFHREVHTQIFLLSDEKDLRTYTDIFQRITDGRAMLSFEERKYDEKLSTWRVLIRWADQYYVAPPELQEKPNGQ